MKIQIICGFLGAGKTTFLKSLLSRQDADTAVLVNEFGELGVDGALIAEGHHLNVVELPSGCICCSLKASLIEAIEDIMVNYRPKRLIIEPSGVASPSSIISGLQAADFWPQIDLEPVVGIIDLTFFADFEDAEDMGSFFLDQILNSDILLLNKVDLVSPAEVEKCRQTIAAINPGVLLMPAAYCQVRLPDIKAKGEVKHFHYSPDFTSEVFSLPGLFNTAKLRTMLEQLDRADCGEVFRAKGIVSTVGGTATFDYVHGLISFGTLSGSAGNKLVFIGRDLNRAKLETAIIRGQECGAD